jgi:hypothetical protein
VLKRYSDFEAFHNLVAACPSASGLVFPRKHIMSIKSKGEDLEERRLQVGRVRWVGWVGWVGRVGRVGRWVGLVGLVGLVGW